MKMSSTLTNSYICPDDLSPLPTTLDAKKSPLALLAQTCSNIGADLLPNNKPIIPPLEKPRKSSMEKDNVCLQNKNNTHDNRSNSTSSVDAKISFKPYETSNRTETPTAAITSCSINSNNGLNNSLSKIRKSEKLNKDSSRSNSVDVINDNSKYSNNNYINKKTINETRNQSPNVDFKSASNRESPLTTTNGAIRTSPYKSLSVSSANSSSNSSGHQNNELNPLIYSTSGITEMSKSQLTTLAKSDSITSKATSMNSYNHNYNLNTSAVAAATNALQNDLLKSSHYSSSLLAPYLNPSHPAANFSLKSNTVCRDPFCKGCQLSSLTGIGNNLPCANGCNGCMHTLNPHPLSGSYLHPSLSSSSYHPASQSNPLSSLRPFVCNWTIAGSYCGKTFSTCEELLQHLKTHTNNTSAFSGLSPFNFSPTLTHGMPTIPNLRSTPSHSSLESLRYHPYKLANNSLQQSIPQPPHVPPSLGSSAATHLSSLTSGGISSYYPSFGMYNGRI